MKLGSKSVVTAIIVGFMALPVVSQAAVRSSQVSEQRVVITYQMEDLKSPEGRASLEQEIREAAGLVCGNVDYGQTRSLRAISERRSCYHQAVAGALTDLGSGQLQVTAR
tara:strand:+ start:9311 stop:9640 length:330 start_codon:yes stop_codon:yes gene_type:complete